MLHHDRLIPYLAEAVPGWIRRKRHALLQGEPPAEATQSPAEDVQTPVSASTVEVLDREPTPITMEHEEPGTDSTERQSESEDELGLPDLFQSPKASTLAPQRIPGRARPRQRQEAARRRRSRAARDEASDPGDPDDGRGESESPPRMTQRGRMVRRPSRFFQ